jgi:hypothetical protein
MPPSAPEPSRPAPPHPDEDNDSLVDVTLVDEMLAMTVLERLQHNDRAIREIAQLRAGFAALGSSRDERSR